MILAMMMMMASGLESTNKVNARKTYKECLLAYAQVEMMGTKTAEAITQEATIACSRERDNFTRSILDYNLLKNMPALQTETEAILQSVVSFIDKNR